MTPQLTAVLFFPLALWMVELMARANFRYAPPSVDDRQRLINVPGWLRFIVKWHDHLKYGGAAALWAGVSYRLIDSPENPDVIILSNVYIGACCVVFAIPLSWRIFDHR